MSTFSLSFLGFLTSFCVSFSRFSAFEVEIKSNDVNHIIEFKIYGSENNIWTKPYYFIGFESFESVYDFNDYLTNLNIGNVLKLMFTTNWNSNG